MKLRWSFVAWAVAVALMAAGCNGQNNANQAKANNKQQTQSTNKTSQEQQQAKQKGTAAVQQADRETAGPTPPLEGGKERTVRSPHPMTLADLREKYHSTFLLNGSTEKRQMALTFDDAPDANFTPKVLDQLKKAGVHATFFVIGNRAEQHPDLIKRMIQEGHVIGNHSYSHPNLPKLKDPQFQQQIIKTDNIIHSLTGYTPKLVRPPYGNINEQQIKWLASQGKKIVNWNIDSLDWKGLDTKEVSTNILAHAMPGAIVLQHAAGGKGEDLTGTVEALPEVIKKLRADGVELVTVPELLGLPYK
ncbi:polysaccharide deacetylase family protein [Brevibacillus fulvus]|uniref:Peptidoglycan/xylan/chitin deacetylase (PgdA/CDA1 family) n=1 Tax=Brevibacillus fulvus TaxID=1125967 RepID=A0A938Y3N5_9BACL|nr:polysaccharide deacetylase family protein [Brevibacillus fulvus]MBM7591749.1 peptidoglycan/xylan/chitin deacetylase (PgdA/CDA1 family) [Brevibacillus fulvus]